MAKSELEHRQDVVEVGRLIWEKGWVASNDGNISVRLEDGRILCTPTGVSKGRMHPEDLILCDAQGNKLTGEKPCTTEIAMHLTVYRLRPDIHAVLHAHPPVATGYAAAGRSLDFALLPEVVIGLGCVPLASYGLPGTPALIEPMLPLIPKYDAVLMGNHGAVCYGEDVFKAFFRMETVEHFARISLVAELLGGAKVLPRLEVQKLLESRSRYGIKMPPGNDTGRPLSAEEVKAERIQATREELVELIDEVLRERGLA
jgi:L-fuculose-phosphate aldolase